MMFFIPARKGSKRIPNKNMAMLAGKPLIQWTFEAIKKANNGSDRILVSSDDDNILDLAEKFGFDVAERPSHLCNDKSTMSDVIQSYMPFFDGEDVCVLYPTSPLRTSAQIVDAVNLWKAVGNKYKTLMSVEAVDHRPYGLMERTSSGFLRCTHPYGELFYQSQGMPPLYRANGAIYIIPNSMLNSKDINSQLFCKKTLPFVMDKKTSHEIDVPEDLLIAEAYMGGHISNTNGSAMTMNGTYSYSGVKYEYV